MKRITLASMILVVSALAVSMPAWAQQAPDAGERIAAQKKAMRPLNAIDGLWRGTATEYQADGKTLERDYTEQITSLLDGTLKLLEGWKESVEGEDDFHVICILSHDPETKKFTMRAYYPEGAVFDVAFDAGADGFGWHADRPDGKRIVATGAIRDGVWHEKIELVMPGKPARLLEERVLKRVDGDK